MTMYERDHMFWQKIRDANRVACSVLLQMSEIKAHVEAGLWPRCLDVSLRSFSPFSPALSDLLVSLPFGVSHTTPESY